MSDETRKKAARSWVYNPEIQQYIKMLHPKSDYVTPLLLRWDEQGNVVATLKEVANKIGKSSEMVRLIEVDYWRKVGYYLMNPEPEKGIQIIRTKAAKLKPPTSTSIKNKRTFKEIRVSRAKSKILVEISMSNPAIYRITMNYSTLLTYSCSDIKNIDDLLADKLGSSVFEKIQKKAKTISEKRK